MKVQELQEEEQFHDAISEVKETPTQEETETQEVTSKIKDLTEYDNDEE